MCGHAWGEHPQRTSDAGESWACGLASGRVSQIDSAWPWVACVCVGAGCMDTQGEKKKKRKKKKEKKGKYDGDTFDV